MTTRIQMDLLAFRRVWKDLQACVARDETDLAFPPPSFAKPVSMADAQDAFDARWEVALEDINTLLFLEWHTTERLLTSRGRLMRQRDILHVNFSLLSAGLFRALTPPVASLIGTFLLRKDCEFTVARSAPPAELHFDRRTTYVTGLRLREEFVRERIIETNRQLRLSDVEEARWEDAYAVVFRYMERGWDP